MVAGLWAGLRPAESRAGAGASARRGWEKWRGIVAAGDPGPGPGRRGVATVPAQSCRARCRDHAAAAAARHRTSVVEGKGVAGRVDTGGIRLIKKKTKRKHNKK